MKLYQPILSICLCALAMPAEAFAKTMIVTPQTSEPKRIEVTTGTRITFSSDLSKMIVSKDDSEDFESFDISDIASIMFSMDSAIDGITSQFNDLRIANNGGIVTISGADTIRYDVWNMAGSRILAGTEEQVVTLDFTALSAGIYIIKANNRTIKFINR